MAMIKSRLLNQSSLTSIIIGVVPKEPEQHLNVSVSNKYGSVYRINVTKKILTQNTV